MKKYYFMWYNCITERTSINFVSADNIKEAKKVAILMMRFITGRRYTYKDFIELKAIDDNSDLFCTREMIENKYKMCNMKIPSLK